MELWIKTCLIICAFAVSMSLFYHFSYFYEKRTPLNLLSKYNYIRQRKFVTVILSLPAIILWGILLQLSVSTFFTPLFRGIVFAFFAVILFVAIEWGIIKFYLQKNKGNALDIIIYIGHSIISIPLLWSVSSFLLENLKSSYPNLKPLHIVAFLAVYFILYFIINEIIFYLHKNIKAEVTENTLPINISDIYGSYILKFPKGYKNVNFNMKNKNNSIYVCFNNDGIKIKGNLLDDKIVADLSGELPRIELYKVKPDKFSGIFINKYNDKELVFPVTAEKENI